MWPLSVCWLIALVVFLIVEGLTVGLVSIWFAAGALCALLVSLFTTNFWIQMGVFLVVSGVTLAALRPLSYKYLGPKQREATNADRVIGAEGIVTEDIDNLEGKGLVMVKGAVWTARSENDNPIRKDTKVIILRIEGVKVFVEPIKSTVGAMSESIRM